MSKRLATVFSLALAGTIVLAVGGYVLFLADRILETAFWPAGNATGIYSLGLAIACYLLATRRRIDRAMAAARDSVRCRRQLAVVDHRLREPR